MMCAKKGSFFLHSFHSILVLFFPEGKKKKKGGGCDLCEKSTTNKERIHHNKIGKHKTKERKCMKPVRKEGIK